MSKSCYVSMIYLQNNCVIHMITRFYLSENEIALK